MNTGVEISKKKVLKNLSKEFKSCAVSVDELSSSIKDRLSKISSFGLTKSDIQKPIPYDDCVLNDNLENLKDLANDFTQDCEKSLKIIHSAIVRLEQCLEYLNNLI